jgi:hypothetical protein
MRSYTGGRYNMNSKDAGKYVPMQLKDLRCAEVPMVLVQNPVAKLYCCCLYIIYLSYTALISAN